MGTQDLTRTFSIRLCCTTGLRFRFDVCKLLYSTNDIPASPDKALCFRPFTLDLHDTHWQRFLRIEQRVRTQCEVRVSQGSWHLLVVISPFSLVQFYLIKHCPRLLADTFPSSLQRERKEWCLVLDLHTHSGERALTLGSKSVNSSPRQSRTSIGCHCPDFSDEYDLVG